MSNIDPVAQAHAACTRASSMYADALAARAEALRTLAIRQERLRQAVLGDKPVEIALIREYYASNHNYQSASTEADNAETNWIRATAHWISLIGAGF